MCRSFARQLCVSTKAPRLTRSSLMSSTVQQFPVPRGVRHQSSSQAQHFLDAVKARRSYYELGRDPPIDHQTIADTIKTTILHCPSSFNSQTTRLLVLFDKDHDKLWDITRDALQAIVPPESFEPTRKKLEGLRGGYGTILFYEDPDPTKELQEQHPLYAAKFPMWAEHSNAMHQYILWTALESHGLGCNLQHYNPVIDQRVASEWNVQREWNLKAQLVFGSIRGLPREKTFKPWEERVSFHGMW